MSHRQWTDEELEEAYQYWAYESEDSSRKTAEYLGIPERTVYGWAKRDTWAQRKRKEQADLADPAVGEAMVELKLGLSQVVKQLIADASNPKADHRNRLDSQRLILAMTFGSQFDISTKSGFLSLTEARAMHKGSESSLPISKKDLRDMASRALEANVSSIDSGKHKRNGIVGGLR